MCMGDIAEKCVRRNAAEDVARFSDAWGKHCFVRLSALCKSSFTKGDCRRDLAEGTLPKRGCRREIVEETIAETVKHRFAFGWGAAPKFTHQCDKSSCEKYNERF